MLDTWVSVIASSVTVLIVAALLVLVLHPRIRLPRLFETGLWLLALGLIVQVEPLISGYGGSALAQVLRWCLICSAIAMIFWSWVDVWLSRRAAGCPMRRVEDSMPVDLDPPIPGGFSRDRRQRGTDHRN